MAVLECQVLTLTCSSTVRQTPLALECLAGAQCNHAQYCKLLSTVSCSRAYDQCVANLKHGHTQGIPTRHAMPNSYKSNLTVVIHVQA